MKICLVGPGIHPIPPSGWGAVELIIWDYAVELRRRGHEVLILNEKFGDREDHERNKDLIYRKMAEINEWGPDFVHFNYDHQADMAQLIDAPTAISSHYGGQADPERRKGYEWIFYKFAKNHSHVFTASNRNTKHFVGFGVKPELVWNWIYGITCDEFRFTNSPSKKFRSVCLGRIVEYKQQGNLQKYCKTIDFIGPQGYGNFDYNDSSYLGPWTQEQVKNQLTEYGNLVLVGYGEDAPRVTMEAMAAGLGLVVSEEASANLDRSLPFIDVIDRKSITEAELNKVINRNREISVTMREDIRDYAYKTFDIKNCCQKYLDKISEILEDKI